MSVRSTSPRRDPRLRALEAFRQLMLENGYRRLTIRSVLERSKVGRATFYAHFRGKEDLLAASVDGLGRFLEAAWTARRSAGETEPFGFARPFFHHAGASRGMLSVLAEEGTEAVLRAHLHRMLARLVRKEFEFCGSRCTRPEDELAVQFLVGALWSTLMEWTRGRTVPADAAASTFVAYAGRVLEARRASG